MNWTDQLDNRLRALYRVLSYAEMAKLFDCEKDDVLKRAKELGIRESGTTCGMLRPTTLINDMQWLMTKCLFDCGFSPREITDHFSGSFGLPYNTLKQRLYVGVKTPDPERYGHDQVA